MVASMEPARHPVYRQHAEGDEAADEDVDALGVEIEGSADKFVLP